MLTCRNSSGWLVILKIFQNLDLGAKLHISKLKICVYNVFENCSRFSRFITLISKKITVLV